MNIDPILIAFFIWSEKIERDVRLHDLTDEEIGGLVDAIRKIEGLEQIS
jgi:hypothetical protein